MYSNNELVAKETILKTVVQNCIFWVQNLWHSIREKNAHVYSSLYEMNKYKNSYA